MQDGDTHALYIPEVFYEDAGKFTVKARNQGGETQVTANLIVQGYTTLLFLFTKLLKFENENCFCALQT